MLLYYVVLKPLQLLPVSEEVSRKYREAGLHCRFSYFSVRDMEVNACSHELQLTSTSYYHTQSSTPSSDLLILKDWREYEHVHTLAWLGKDYAWACVLPELWVLCLVPTILIAIDFIWTTWKAKVTAALYSHSGYMNAWLVSNDHHNIPSLT